MREVKRLSSVQGASFKIKKLVDSYRLGASRTMEMGDSSTSSDEGVNPPPVNVDSLTNDDRLQSDTASDYSDMDFTDSDESDLVGHVQCENFFRGSCCFLCHLSVHFIVIPFVIICRKLAICLMLKFTNDCGSYSIFKELPNDKPVDDMDFSLFQQVLCSFTIPLQHWKWLKQP
jgi:hypothetical protein